MTGSRPTRERLQAIRDSIRSWQDAPWNDGVCEVIADLLAEIDALQALREEPKLSSAQEARLARQRAAIGVLLNQLDTAQRELKNLARKLADTRAQVKATL